MLRTRTLAGRLRGPYGGDTMKTGTFLAAAAAAAAGGAGALIGRRRWMGNGSPRPAAEPPPLTTQSSPGQIADLQQAYGADMAPTQDARAR
jgi:hypothetical protein